ncbi:hypothetical protein [Streptomyces coeruleorubidus]|uniref:hypothetical protein n=1 Tax=Streptomyces coeruleorubidus TaxID=116188 RepID=UPI0033E6EBCA
MTTQGPGRGGTPEEPDGAPSGSEEVWLKFLTDSERAIGVSAPREPSARERAQGWPSRSFAGDSAEQRTRRPDDEPASGTADAVGELWHLEEPWTGPAWRDLDGQARLRRVGRVVATSAAVVLALGAWSLLSTRDGTPGEGPDDTMVQQLEDAPAERPTGPPLPPGSAAVPTSSVTAGG